MREGGGKQSAALLVVGARLPKRSETFVYREVFGLRERGMKVLVASVHKPERGLGEDRLDRLAEEAIGVYGMGGYRLLWDAWLGLVGDVLRTFRTVISTTLEWVGEGGWKTARGWRVFLQMLGGLALAHRVKGLGVGHVHAHMAHVPSTIGLVAARQLGVPFSFTGHAADLFRDASLLSSKLKAAAFVACISEWHREYYRALWPRGDGVYPIIRCGVDIPELSLKERPDQSLVVMAVARLVPKKGIDLLLRAIALLECEGLSLRVAVVGDGPERVNLRTLCDGLGIAGVVDWVGALPHREVCNKLREATVFVLPCRVDRDGDRDGIPVVLMEAMAVGVPCVSGNLPAVRELIEDGETGRLVKPDDVLELKEAIGEMLRDADLRRRCAMQGRRRVEEEFSSNVNLPRFVAALDGGVTE